MTDTILHVLCAGAVQGIVKALQPAFEQAGGARLVPRFAAVGALKEALLAGDPCDVMIATEAMVASLQASGDLAGDPCAPLGKVRTGLAVRAGEPLPDVSTAEALRAALLGATAILFPDPTRATAGIHFAGVLAALGIADRVAPRIRNFPNGATSMRELATSDAGAIGCTQISEILYTPGIVLLGALPEKFELATTYAAGVAARSGAPELARRFIELLAGPTTQPLRARGGFELG